MLAVEPEKTVIAPERAAEAAAKRFEANVEATPAPVAADLAGAVQAERDRLSAGLPAEKQDARLAEISASIEGRAPRGAEPTVMAMSPDLLPSELDLVRSLLRLARVEVRLRLKHLAWFRENHQT
jgi:hypothetical protein